MDAITLTIFGWNTIPKVLIFFNDIQIFLYYYHCCIHAPNKDFVDKIQDVFGICYGCLCIVGICNFVHNFFSPLNVKNIKYKQSKHS